MELNGLSESQLDLVYFALNHAIESSRSEGNDLPFVVSDRETGRESIPKQVEHRVDQPKSQVGFRIGSPPSARGGGSN